MKKIFSTALGRAAIVAIVVVLIIGAKLIADRVVPIQVLNAVKSNKLVALSDGSLKLPWYWRMEATAGYAYVTQKFGHYYIVFPQEAGGETRFSGEMATDDDIIVGKSYPAPSGLTQVFINSPVTAADPSDGAENNQIFVLGKLTHGVYSVANSQE